MNLDEIAFVVIAKSRTRGAVGFVTDDQVKICQLLYLLGFADDVNGVVGAEHHAHVVAIVALEHFSCQAGRFRGGWIAQLMGEGLNDIVVLFALFPHVAVRTNGEAVQGRGAFLGPLG